MATWPKRPIIYEINTWVWLNDLSQRHQREVTLKTVPEEEWNGIAALGVDAVIDRLNTEVAAAEAVGD